MHGFLGEDSRDLVQIIDEDIAVLQELGLRPGIVADAMEHFREEGSRGLGEFISVAPHFLVKVDSVRGKLPCPFGDPGLIPKTNITVRNQGKNIEIKYTDLNIHCIREHAFFEGKGSPFRVEPGNVVEVLEIKPLEDI